MTVEILSKGKKQISILLWDTKAGQFYVYGNTKAKIIYLNPKVIKQLEDGEVVILGDQTITLRRN